MHKLARGQAPQCLSQFKHGRNQWREVSSADKDDIWGALEAMQGKRCAYCEADISDGKSHIEHFRQRNFYPQGTFEWANLFGSCNRSDSCGKHKDNCTYRHEDLLKPDEDNPEVYLLFVTDGSITPRNDLSDKDKLRAAETLRVFNLDHEHGPLRQMRKKAMIGYLQTAEEFSRWAEICPQEEWLPLLEEELLRIISLPFATAIKHALTSQVIA